MFDELTEENVQTWIADVRTVVKACPKDPFEEGLMSLTPGYAAHPGQQLICRLMQWEYDNWDTLEEDECLDDAAEKVTRLLKDITGLGIVLTRCSGPTREEDDT